MLLLLAMHSGHNLPNNTLHGPGQMNWIGQFLLLKDCFTCVPCSSHRTKGSQPTGRGARSSNLAQTTLFLQDEQQNLHPVVVLIPVGNLNETDEWRLFRRPPQQAYPHRKRCGTSSLTVTEGTRGPAHSFHHPIHLPIWDVEAKRQLIISNAVTFYDGRAKGMRAALQ